MQGIFQPIFAPREASGMSTRGTNRPASRVSNVAYLELVDSVSTVKSTSLPGTYLTRAYWVTYCHIQHLDLSPGSIRQHSVDDADCTNSDDEIAGATGIEVKLRAGQKAGGSGETIAPTLCAKRLQPFWATGGPADDNSLNIKFSGVVGPMKSLQVNQE